MKAIIYPRVSSLRQVDNTSLGTQEAECRAWCVAKGVSIEQVFLEKGESAKSADRTQLTAALAYIAARKDIDFFVVHKVDRFARESRDFHNLVCELAQVGCKLVSVSEPFDYETPAGRFMAGVLSLQAQFDTEVRAERSKNGMLSIVKRGGWAWRPPIGYKTARLQDNMPTLVHDPAVAHIIRRVFETFARGTMTIEEMRRTATGWGLLTENGKALGPQAFKLLLTCQLYAARFRTRLVPGEHKGNWEPIVEPELFDAVQRRLVGSTQAGIAKRPRPEYPLKGTLLCARCGRRMLGSASSGRGGRKYPYYHCEHCKGQRLRAETMHAAFESLLEWIAIPQGYFAELKQRARTELATAATHAAELRESQAQALAKLARDEERLLDLVMRGTVSDDAYDARLQKIRTEKSAIKARHEALDIEVEDFESTIQRAQMVLLEPGNFWRKAQYDAKIQLQKLWYPDGLTYDGRAEAGNVLKPKGATSSKENAAPVPFWLPHMECAGNIIRLFLRVAEISAA